MHKFCSILHLNNTTLTFWHWWFKVTFQASNKHVCMVLNPFNLRLNRGLGLPAMVACNQFVHVCVQKGARNRHAQRCSVKLHAPPLVGPPPCWLFKLQTQVLLFLVPQTGEGGGEWVRGVAGAPGSWVPWFQPPWLSPLLKIVHWVFLIVRQPRWVPPCCFFRVASCSLTSR